MTTSVSDARAWYIIDVATGGSLDSADRGHRLTLPTGREVMVTGHDRPSTLAWQDADPETGTTDSGGSLTLKGWIDSSTTITVSHHVNLPEGTRWASVAPRQHLLDEYAKAHAKAWVTRFARHGAANTGTD